MVWGDMDTPLTEDHKADWEKNVGAHCKSTSYFNYFKRIDEHSYNPENQVTASKTMARIFTITGNRARVLDAVGEISKVFKAKNYQQARRVYSSVFNLENGQEVAIIFPFESFKTFETSILPEGFMQTFEEINGFGSWQRLILDPIVENSDGFYDEVRVLVE